MAFFCCRAYCWYHMYLLLTQEVFYRWMLTSLSLASTGLHNPLLDFYHMALFFLFPFPFSLSLFRRTEFKIVVEWLASTSRAICFLSHSVPFRGTWLRCIRSENRRCLAFCLQLLSSRCHSWLLRTHKRIQVYRIYFLWCTSSNIK